MHKLSIAAVVTTLAVGMAGCATGVSQAKFNQLTGRVTTMDKTLDQTQDRVKQDETKIAAAEQHAGAAQQAADRAEQSASAAKASAATAMTTAQDASAKVDALGRRLMFSVVLNEDEGNFVTDQSVLPTAAKAKLDDIAKRLLAGPKRGYLDIEGYTDNTGTPTYNQQLGLARARAVMRYLNDHCQVPLWRMNVISYGEDHPVATNATTQGRAENRRVEVKVWM